jgi:hypothetical protein
MSTLETSTSGPLNPRVVMNSMPQAARLHKYFLYKYFG